MKRRIIVLIDGTGCTASKGFRKHFTNVFRTQAAVKENPEVSNIFLYFPGPGTRNVPSKLLNSIFGWETVDIAKEAYSAICTNIFDFNQDEIYIFGYSRGAVAVKALVSLISKCGLLRRGEIQRLGNAWNYFQYDRADNKIFLLGKSERKHIEFVGLFDPVLGPEWASLDVRMDLKLTTTVKFAVELLCLDERRFSYKPSPWTEPADEQGTISGSIFDSIVAPASEGVLTPRLQQIWIPGGHGDIGNANGSSILSDISFLTMMERLRAKTLIDINVDYINKLLNEVINFRGEIRIKRRDMRILRKTRKLDDSSLYEIHPLYSRLNGQRVRLNLFKRFYPISRNGDLSRSKEYYFDIDTLCPRTDGLSSVMLSEAVTRILSQQA